MADIFFYNQLTAQKEKFTPLNDSEIGLYTCGPTVYSFVHIGNLRSYLFEDILRRVLEYNFFKVNQVMNLTDVEDKIIKKMKEEKKTLEEVTNPYSEAFFKDLEKLNIQKASHYPKATEHIQEMIEIIQKLLEKGVAYQKEGSVYFSLEKFPEYGKLSKLDKREIKVGARVNVDEYSKENAEDFVLWKASLEGEPSWPSPYGVGRPGWHIECSSMSMKYLGDSFDIHGGAVDLIFPHHENEIAQSEASTGKKFVNYWLEGEHLLVENQKMAKSLGNIFTLKEIEEKKIKPLAFRYLILTTHYQSKLNFTWDSLAGASNALNNLYSFASTLKEEGPACADYEKRFLEAINDNLDMPKALTIVWELVKSDCPKSAKARSLKLFDKVLGLGLEKVMNQPLPSVVEDLIARREKLRGENKFEEADLVRKKIEDLGYFVKDTPEGVELSKKFN